jgi:queuine/archaeosine tRNA-ribosyltransferase
MGVGTPGRPARRHPNCGIDMFDCVMPTRNARGGTPVHRHGESCGSTTRSTGKTADPVDTHCGRHAVARSSRMALRHLYYAREPLFETLASIHNVHFYEDLMKDARTAIEAATSRPSRAVGCPATASTRRSNARPANANTARDRARTSERLRAEREGRRRDEDAR